MLRALGTRAFLDAVQLRVLGCYPTRALAEEEESRLIAMRRTHLAQHGFNHLPGTPGRSRLWWALHNRCKLPGARRDRRSALLARALHSGSDTASGSLGARIDAEAAQANAIGARCTYTVDELVLGAPSAAQLAAVTPADLQAALARMEAAVSPCHSGTDASTAPLPSVSDSSVQLLHDTADCAQSVLHIDLTHCTSDDSM